jgi:hypothetical protein
MNSPTLARSSRRVGIPELNDIVFADAYLTVVEVEIKYLRQNKKALIQRRQSEVCPLMMFDLLQETHSNTSSTGAGLLYKKQVHRCRSLS